MANGHGGARANSGRKPLAITLARQAIVSNKIEAGEAAFAFQEAIMYDDTQTLMARQSAACWIYENVFGKPLQMTRNAESDEYKAAGDWRAGKSADEIAAVEEAVRIVNEGGE